jgi:hypothetical protein
VIRTRVIEGFVELIDDDQAIEQERQSITLHALDITVAREMIARGTAADWFVVSFANGQLVYRYVTLRGVGRVLVRRAFNEEALIAEAADVRVSENGERIRRLHAFSANADLEAMLVEVEWMLAGVAGDAECAECAQTCVEACSKHSSSKPHPPELNTCGECGTEGALTTNCTSSDRFGTLCGYEVCADCWPKHRARCDRWIADSNDVHERTYGTPERGPGYDGGAP